jgi:hypothetical protein
MGEARERLVGSFEERLDPLVIHYFRAVNPGFEHEAFCVYQDVSLAALDLLAPVVTTLIASHAGALDRLGIHHTGARLGISLLAHPQTLAQGGVDPLPGAVDTPHPQVMVDGLPRREVVGK